MVTIATEALSVELGGRRVLDDVTVTLERGALIGVIGPNGAGKSTLARALLGLFPAPAGSVTIDGGDVATLGSAAIARRVAYLPQAYALHWPLSVARLVGLGRLPHLGPFSRIGAEDQAAIDAALRDTGTAHLADRTATGAPALIADEPLTALYPGHQLEVMDLLRDQARGGALILVILHDLSIAARFCDRLLLLDGGRLVADGAPDAVLTDAALASVYGITAWRGEMEGQAVLMPFGRVPGPPSA